MTSLRRLALSVLLCLGAAALPGKADVIFTNMNPDSGNRYGGNAYTVQSSVPDRGMGYVSIAAPFTVSGNARLDNILIAIVGNGNPNFGTSGVDVLLYNDLNGAPNAVIEQWDNVTPQAGCCGVGFLISASRPLLEAGKQYWLMAAPNPAVFTTVGTAFTAAQWRHNNTGDIMPYLAIRTSANGPLVVQTAADRFSVELIRPAMEIRGTPFSFEDPEPNPTAVPEGSSVVSALSAIGLALVASKRRGVTR